MRITCDSECGTCPMTVYFSLRPLNFILHIKWLTVNWFWCFPMVFASCMLWLYFISIVIWEIEFWPTTSTILWVYSYMIWRFTNTAVCGMRRITNVIWYLLIAFRGIRYVHVDNINSVGYSQSQPLLFVTQSSSKLRHTCIFNNLFSSSRKTIWNRIHNEVHYFLHEKKKNTPTHTTKNIVIFIIHCVQI